MGLPHGAPSAAQAIRTGRYFEDLLRNPDWTVRRTETIAFLDQVRAERVVSLDLDFADLKRRARRFRVGGKQVPFPIAKLKKSLPLDLEVRDSGSVTVPVAVSDQDSHVACAVLLATLERNGEDIRRLPESVIWQMYSVVRAPDLDELLRLLRAIEPVPDDDVDLVLADADRQHWVRLLADGQFFETLLEFAQSYLVLVEVGSPKKAIASFTFRIVDESNNETRRFPWLSSRRIGIRPQRFRFAATGIGSAQREHTRIVAPESSSIHRGFLELDGVEVAAADYQVRESFERLVVYTQNRRPGNYSIVVTIEPTRASFLVPAALSTGFMSLILLFATWLQFADGRFSGGSQIGEIREQAMWSWAITLFDSGTADLDGSVTILALVPSLLAVYFVRAGEHEIVTRLLSIPRGLVVAAAMATVFAGAATAASVEPLALQNVYLVALSLSLISFALTTYASSRVSLGRWMALRRRA